MATERQPEPGGAGALVEALLDAGVEVVFGLPGVHNLPIWSALADSEIRLVGVRHEQTAAYAADGYARVTGRLGVALTTTGPGAANAAAATGEALASGSPIVVIATDISSRLRRPGVRRGALHEVADQAAIFEPLTKATVRVAAAGDIAGATRDACRAALTPPSGPVFLEIPTNLLSEPAGAGHPERGVAAGEVAGPEVPGLGEAVGILAAAERPLIWAGGGAAGSPGAREAVGRLAERLGAPVLETHLGRGMLDSSHPCRVGLPPALAEAGSLWDEADAVLAIGSDLDGTNTQNWRLPVPPRLIAVNVSAADAAKNYVPDVLLAGDAAEVAGRLADLLPERPGLAAALAGRLDGLRRRARERLAEEEPLAFELMDSLAAAWSGEWPIACDMCIPGYWVAGFLDLPGPRSLLYPMGWGTLGFALPASIGAALGADADGGRALCLCGDGGFLFACGELAVLAQEQIRVTILLIDDGGYGMLRYDFESVGEPAVGVDLQSPRWGVLADAFGIPWHRADDLGDSLRDALGQATETEGPCLIFAEAALTPPPTTSPRWHRAEEERRSNG